MPFGTLETLMLASSWVFLLTMLVLDLTGVLRRGTGFRWTATGYLIAIAAEGSSRFAQSHDWTGSWASVLGTAAVAVAVAGFAIGIRGAVIQDRERRKARRSG
jgi:hypothetical protein